MTLEELSEELYAIEQAVDQTINDECTIRLVGCFGYEDVGDIVVDRKSRVIEIQTKDYGE